MLFSLVVGIFNVIPLYSSIHHLSRFDTSSSSKKNFLPWGVFFFFPFCFKFMKKYVHSKKKRERERERGVWGRILVVA
jgi:hypothetical protein